MNLAQPSDWVNKPFEGYIVNTAFSDENTKVVSDVTKQIQAALADAVFCMPDRSLHTTLLDWIAPLVDYDGQDKAKLFAQVQPTYDKALTEALAAFGPITVHFDEIRVAPSTIFMIGHDDGQFQKIRDSFMQNVELLPGTKLPPTIIHSSLARFTQPIDLDMAGSVVAKLKVDFIQTVTDFRLIHTSKEPMLEFEILKQYRLLS
jgi:hypothetical protein